MTARFSFLLFFLFSFIISLAQPTSQKFGQVTLEELEEGFCPVDSTAGAAILMDLGLFDGSTFKFTRRTRIKIYNQTGLDRANMAIQKAPDGVLRGYTYNLVNGEIVKTKLEKEHIYVEKVVRGFELINFTFPEVKTGSIIELEYTESSFPLEWRFQDQIPVLWSELWLGESYAQRFRKMYYGMHPVEELGKNHWVAQNVPAITREPYMSAISNYITRYTFDLAAGYLDNFGAGPSEINSSWEAVAKLIMDPGSSVLATELNRSRRLWKDISDSLKSKDERETIENAFNYIKRTTQWDGTMSLPISKGMAEFIRGNEQGNSSDINLALLSLLQSMKIEAYPVVLSTRDNGLISPISASLRKLNYLIVYCKLDDGYILLDATDKLLPVSMLPERCLNGLGIIIKDDGIEWLDMIPDDKYTSSTFMQLSLLPDGLLSGTVDNKYLNHASYKFRSTLGSFAQQADYSRHLESRIDGLEITGHSFENLDSLDTYVLEHLSVNISNRAGSAGNGFFVELNLIDSTRQNPFIKSARHYPVDFIYPRSQMTSLNIRMPEGFSAQNLPENVLYSLPDGSCKFVFSISQFNGGLQVMYRLDINKVIFTEDEYPDLRKFYAEVMAKLDEKIFISGKS